ncbi:FIST signal transduction protein [Arsenicibacter rosenii]|uniref:Histidine kinase n=1 Tax=Arsenicibacter rosenii TaxID=1750698 RepID=A0A1S2VGE7_9BACT|nr:FIST N-terminal domain-containing protein [Arsenicibacter rosenii]OIN57831.1 histidine kinase [Arsenicibacter rosenii]
MKLSQSIYNHQAWAPFSEATDFTPEKAQLVLAFGERQVLENTPIYESLRERFPNASIIINSTSGEIHQDRVYDNSVVVTAVEFEKTIIRTCEIDIESHPESYAAGLQVAQALKAPDLAGIFIISDGGVVNGSDLINGLNQYLQHTVPITGGLAGDADRFERTLVGLDHDPVAGKVVGVGFYGDSLKIGHGSMAGWDAFGPERAVTHSEYNVLYQIGDKHALDLYKEYLGKYAKDLPGAALRFPLSMRTSPDAPPLVRTILTIDEEKKSMTFAGDMPEGALVRFMTANFDRLVDASAEAAQTSLTDFNFTPELVILISCVGRKLVLGERIDEEIEVARDVFGPAPTITGFYSYGEIAPMGVKEACELHNQTMTITVLAEL